MRVYTVLEGDTPEGIASRDDMAGCPRCAKDLVECNGWRASVRRANGFLTFRDPLVAGEQLWLPEKWFDGTLDRAPKSYFDSLPDPMGLGQLPPEHVPQLYEVQPGDTAETIALKFGQADAAALAVLVDANPSLPTTTQKDGTKTFCSLEAGVAITLPDRWFAAGSSWSAIRPGCNPIDVTLSPGAVAQISDQNHPPPKEIALSVHPSAIEAMQSASGGVRDTKTTVATAAAGTSAVVGTAVVGTVLTHLALGAVSKGAESYLGKIISDLF